MLLTIIHQIQLSNPEESFKKLLKQAKPLVLTISDLINSHAFISSDEALLNFETNLQNLMRLKQGNNVTLVNQDFQKLIKAKGDSQAYQSLFTQIQESINQHNHHASTLFDPHLNFNKSTESMKILAKKA